MGCSLITITSFPVLILASIAANTKVTTDVMSSVQKTEQFKTISTVSSVGVITSEANPGVTDAQYAETNCTESNAKDENNNTFLENFNWTDSNNVTDERNCSFDTATFSSNAIPVVNTSKHIISFRDFKDFEYYRNAIAILPYAPNIPGVITNSLTLIIAANIKPLHTSEMYMITLGCSDLITVLIRCTYYVWSTYRVEDTEVSCKVPRYIKHVSLIFSNMTLMAWTIERIIAVIFPIKLTTLCSVRNTKITLILLLLLCLLLAIPYFTETEVYTVDDGKITVTTCFESDFMGTVWTHVESLYYIYIPVVCVSVCNIAILCRLGSMAKSRISMTTNQEIIDKKASEHRRMTILLLTISACFLVLHLPYAILLVFNYIYPDISSFITKDPKFFAKYLLYSTIAFLITDFQNSVNFFLYCISGNKFRATFKKIFCKAIIKLKRTHEVQLSATRSTEF